MDNIEKTVAEYKDCLGCGHKSCLSLMSECHKKFNIEHYWMEAYSAIAGSISLDRLEEICQAERDGRCVVFAINAGDMVYQHCDALNEIGAYEIDTVHHAGHGNYYDAVWFKAACAMDDIAFDEADIGKTIFLTREAAEVAMKGGQP